MSQAKHKSFRRVLSVTRSLMSIGAESVPVVSVLWCLVDRETSRSIYTTHAALTVYVGGRKFNGIAAWMSHGQKAFRLELKAPLESKELNGLERRSQEALNHAALEYLGRFGEAKRFTGDVAWCSSGTGALKCPELDTTFFFYACNFVGADSGFPELVTNVTVNRGDVVSFSISQDAFTTKACGAINLKLESKGA